MAQPHIASPTAVPSEPLDIGSNLPNTSPLPNLDIPNEPFITDIKAFLQRELVSQTLDELAPALAFVARKGGSNIDALHVQLIKNRSIVITEDPGLHLVWHSNIIYIKPIPHCLFSLDFWTTYLPAPPSTPSSSPPSQNSHDSLACPQYRRAAIGLLRSYAYLIRHPSDFSLAQTSHLLPSTITYTSFQHFIHPFLHIDSANVSPRYSYGQLRLTRLNWIIRFRSPPSRKQDFFTRRWYYQEIRWGIKSYISHIAGLLIFMFATISLILSSMQVAFAARPNDLSKAFMNVSWGFSIAVIVLFVAIFMIVGIGILVVLAVQLNFGLKIAKEDKKIDDIMKANKNV